MKATTTVLLAGILALVLAIPGFAAPNLLVNPSFEDGPTYGDFTGVPYAPSGWTQGPENSTADYNWQGVYDSSWKNHNCNYPIWPDPVHQAVDGTHFLGKWMPGNGGCEVRPYVDKRGTGYIYQTINGLTPGTKYYISVWAATYHIEYWKMARIVALPQTLSGGTYTPPLHPTYPINTPFMDASPVPTYASTGRVAAPAEKGDLAEWPYYEKQWAISESKWGKITCELTLAPGQNACTVFLEQQISENDNAEYIQMDAARVATKQLLEIKNIQITNTTPTGATVEWDVCDGDNTVIGAATSVEYGLTTTYGATKAGSELDPDYCHPGTPEPTPGRPGHYSATLTGLTVGPQYHFRVLVNTGNYKYATPYVCGSQSPVEGWRDYEPAQSVDQFPLAAKPSVAISSIVTSGITRDSATITWTTNVPATSQLNYSLFSTINDVKTDPVLKTSHSVTLTGLLNNGSYSYTIKATAPDCSDTTSSTKTFKTLVGPNIMNGDFEYGASRGAKALFWTDVPLFGALTSRQWGLNAMYSHTGTWYCGMLTNGGAHPTKGYGVYQQVATTPGDIISVYAWSWATGQANADGETGVPHRFGEINNQIGVDPTGAVIDPLWGEWPAPGTVWGGQLSSLDWHAFLPNPASRTGDYRRIGVCAIAGSDKATIYLRTRSWFGNNWLFNSFDDVTLEPPTPVHSVGALKALPMQTNVNLTQGDYVVTYVQDYPVPDENNGENCFYIQDRAKGGAGIKVTLGSGAVWPSGITKGMKLNIIGTIDWGVFTNSRFGNLDQQTRLDKPAGEMVLRAVKITDTNLSASLPEPVGVTNFSLGGGSSADCYFTNAGAAGGSGANNVGMRVRTWGKIAKINTDNNGWVYMIIDDGSRLPIPPATPITIEHVQVDINNKMTYVTGHMIKTSKIAEILTVPGLYVQTMNDVWPTHDDGSQVAEGDYVILTGISGVRLDLDPDDHQCVVPGTLDPANPNPDLIPEAEKNMRFIKLDPENGAKYLKIQ